MLTAGDTVVIAMVLALMHLQSRAGDHSAGVMAWSSLILFH